VKKISDRDLLSINTNLIYQTQREEVLNIWWKPIISKYFVTITDSSLYRTNLLVRNTISDHYKISLDGLISLNLGDYVCLRCGSISSNFQGNICLNCKTREETAYEQCLFHSPYSIYEKKCTIDNVACNLDETIEKCFSKFYLYFGRFGEIIKVGISRLTIGKLKYRRLIEQGLNEAVVVYPFNSLAGVTAAERLLIDEFGLKESITFEEKVNSMSEASLIQIENLYSINQIKELFFDKNIKQINIYPDNQLNDILPSFALIKSEKYITKIQGLIIYTRGNIGLLKQGKILTFFDISKLVGRMVERDIIW